MKNHRTIASGISFLQAGEPLVASRLVARVCIAVQGARLPLPTRDCKERIGLDAYDVDVHLLHLLVPIAMDAQVSDRFRCACIDLFPLGHTRRETDLCVVVLNGWHNTPRSVA